MNVDETVSKDDFDTQRAVWVETHIPPVVAAIRGYAERRTRGMPQVAQVYLRDHSERSAEIAEATLSTVVMGIIRQDGLTSIAANVARHVAARLEAPLADPEYQAVQIGMTLISAVCEATQACKIEDKHGDKPNKVEGGIKLTPVYELVVTKGQFLEDAVKYGAVGMPTFAKNGARPWKDQSRGGVEGQGAMGMMHSGAKQMKGVTRETAPALYRAVNIAQAARFRINPVTAKVVKDYDRKKATTWLYERLLAKANEEAEKAEAEGLPVVPLAKREEAAMAKAREAARL